MSPIFFRALKVALVASAISLLLELASFYHLTIFSYAPQVPAVLLIAVTSFAVSCYVLRKEEYVRRELAHEFNVDRLNQGELWEKTERALLQSESALRSMVDNAPYGICWATRSGDILRANDALCRIVGVASVDRLLSMNMASFYVNPDNREFIVNELLRNGSIRDCVAQWKKADGTPISVVLNARMREGHNPDSLILECYTGDITERVRSDQELRRINRTLAALSEFNESVLHATDEGELLNQVCNTIVKTAGYCSAWVGFALEDQQNSISPVASAGCGSDLVADADLTWKSGESLRSGPIGDAIRNGTVAVVHDLRSNPSLARCRASAVEQHPCSTIALPLRDSARVIGAISIYSCEQDAFGAVEVELLKKLADDISHGLSLINNKREKRIAEETLRQSEERYRFLFTHNPHPMWLFDVETRRIQEVNDAAIANYGYSREEFLSMQLEDLRPADEVPALLQHLRDVCPDTTFYKTNSKHRKKNSEIIFVEIAAYRFMQNGRIFTLVSSTDITERVRAENALRESEESYRALYEHNHAAVFHTADGRLIDCNDAMCQMLGYSRRELEHLDLSRLYRDPEQRRLGRRMLERDGKLTNYQVDLLRKDGKVVTVLANLNFLKESASRETVLVGVMLDITEVRELEMQLRQAQKLEAIGQLTGGIAHDFNNLLMIINSYSEIMLTKMETANPYRRSVEQIMQAGERAASLTRQLLAFSRKQVMTPVLLRVDEMVKGLHPMLQRLIGEDMTLSIASERELWAVKADPSQLEQVLMNLVVNARDAMPSGGRIDISIKNVLIDDRFVRANRGAAVGEFVLLSVTDSGTGMNKEIQSRIFEPFFSTKPPGRGTGLGLSTVYGIVKQSGGYIKVSSTPGMGSTFAVYLPRSVQKEESTRENLATPKVAISSSILVVEDEPATRKAIRVYLEEHGMLVLEASNGEEALNLFKSGEAAEVDILLTDVIMPSMNGSDLAIKVKNVNPAVSVIYMSGYTDDVLARKGVQNESIVLLSKPFQLPDLLAAITRIEKSPSRMSTVR